MLIRVKCQDGAERGQKSGEVERRTDVRCDRVGDGSPRTTSNEDEKDDAKTPEESYLWMIFRKKQQK